MGMEATGRLHTIFETKQVSERFTKREFVLELNDNPKYPQVVLFQLTGDRCAQLDQFAVGDEVRLEFSLRGREWRNPQGEVKYFNSLDVWKLEPMRARAAGGPAGRGRAADPRDAGPRDAGFRDAGSSPRNDEPRPGDLDDIPF